MEHFRAICAKIPITTNDCTVDLVSDETQMEQKFIKHTRDYIFRLKEASVVSARYLGEQAMQDNIPDGYTVGRWTTGTLLSHCIIVHRFLTFYGPTKASKPIPNQVGKRTLKSENPKHFQWHFRDVPLNFDYITEGEKKMLQKHHASILLPVRVMRGEDENIYEPTMRNRELAPQYNLDTYSENDEVDDESDTDTTTQDNTTPSEESMGEEPGENDTDYEDS
jgi:hypothetical protein